MRLFVSLLSAPANARTIKRCKTKLSKLAVLLAEIFKWNAFTICHETIHRCGMLHLTHFDNYYSFGFSFFQPNTRITSTIAGRWNNYTSAIIARSEHKSVPPATIPAHAQLKHRSFVPPTNDESPDARRRYEWSWWTSITAGRVECSRWYVGEVFWSLATWQLLILSRIRSASVKTINMLWLVSGHSITNSPSAINKDLIEKKTNIRHTNLPSFSELNGQSTARNWIASNSTAATS